MDFYTIVYTKVNLKQINYLHVRVQTIKLLEENMRKSSLHLIWHNFLDMILKA
jgi:hypothetical protein